MCRQRTASQRITLLLDELKAALRKARVQIDTDLISLRRVEPALAVVAELLCLGREHALLVCVFRDGPGFRAAPDLGAAVSTSVVSHWPSNRRPRCAPECLRGRLCSARGTDERKFRAGVISHAHLHISRSGAVRRHAPGVLYTPGMIAPNVVPLAPGAPPIGAPSAWNCSEYPINRPT